MAKDPKKPRTEGSTQPLWIAKPMGARVDLSDKAAVYRAFGRAAQNCCFNDPEDRERSPRVAAERSS